MSASTQIRSRMTRMDGFSGSYRSRTDPEMPAGVGRLWVRLALTGRCEAACSVHVMPKLPVSACVVGSAS